MFCVQSCLLCTIRVIPGKIFRGESDLLANDDHGLAVSSDFHVSFCQSSVPYQAL